MPGGDLDCTPAIKNADMFWGTDSTREECGDHEELITGHSVSRFLNLATQEASTHSGAASAFQLALMGG